MLKSICTAREWKGSCTTAMGASCQEELVEMERRQEELEEVKPMEDQAWSLVLHGDDLAHVSFVASSKLESKKERRSVQRASRIKMYSRHTV